MSSKTKFKTTDLFDGAMSCEIPTNFADVSKIREVPSNQEVFIDKDGFTSVIIELTERVGPAGSSTETDGKALSVHLEEIVGEEDLDGLKVWNTTDTEFSKVGTEFPAYTLIATQTPKIDPSKGQSSAPDFTALILTLLRLEREKTDVLITVNVPHIKGSYDEEEIDLAMGKQGELIGDAVEYAARVWATFQIHDWKVFKDA